MSEIKKVNIKEFRESGYLQELNRQFLHPLGMALEVTIDEEGNEKLGDIWDYRNDPEGILYSNDVIKSKKFKDNKNFVENEYNLKASYRIMKYGFTVQK